MKQTFLKKNSLYILLFLIILYQGCAKNEFSGSFTPALSNGTSELVGNGVVAAYIRFLQDGSPDQVGITLTYSILTGLDNVNEKSVTLEFDKSTNNTPFDHITFKWEPNGHPPQGIYTLPHFDVSFYLISEADQNNIRVTGTDSATAYKTPEADKVPAGYALLPNSGADSMGVYYYDTTAAEFHGAKFTKSFLYGFYNASMIFMEPTVTKEFLDGKNYFRGTIKQPKSYPKPGYYPQTFIITNNPSQKLFAIYLTDFVKK